MDEKTMINDVLEGVKTEITSYSQAITETENMQLRNTMQQIRNAEESLDCSTISLNNQPIYNSSTSQYFSKERWH